MFGYVTAYQKGLCPSEAERYQSIYCGLCRELNQRYGFFARFGLSYDMTFLALFLSAFYAPTEERGEMRCILHPRKKRPYVQNKYIAYAADITILLSYYKCMDDWKDERNALKGFFALMLKKSFLKASALRPVQAGEIKNAMEAFLKAEEAGVSADEAANAFGQLLGAVFALEADVWEQIMRQFGMALGQFLYMMDAVMDYETDRKRGRHNPLFLLGKTPGEAADILTEQIGRATCIFERMPFVEDAELLRNILYQGVWQKYMQQKRGDK